MCGAQRLASRRVGSNPSHPGVQFSSSPSGLGHFGHFPCKFNSRADYKAPPPPPAMRAGNARQIFVQSFLAPAGGKNDFFLPCRPFVSFRPETSCALGSRSFVRQTVIRPAWLDELTVSPCGSRAPRPAHFACFQRCRTSHGSSLARIFVDV